MNIDLEKLLIKKFVIKEKQNRYLSFFEKEKTRKKFLDKLDHFRDFDWKLFEEIPGSQNEEEVILNKLKSKIQINNCYIISVNDKFDGKTFTIKEAFEVLEEGTIKIFGKAEIVYYEGEAPRNRFISK